MWGEGVHHRGQGGPCIHLWGGGLTTEGREVPGSICGERGGGGWRPQRTERSQDPSVGRWAHHRRHIGPWIHLWAGGLTNDGRERHRDPFHSEGGGTTEGREALRFTCGEEDQPLRAGKSQDSSVGRGGGGGRPQRTERSQDPSVGMWANHRRHMCPRIHPWGGGLTTEGREALGSIWVGQPQRTGRHQDPSVGRGGGGRPLRAGRSQEPSVGRGQTT